jgi:hypothetical protein
MDYTRRTVARLERAAQPWWAPLQKHGITRDGASHIARQLLRFRAVSFSGDGTTEFAALALSLTRNDPDGANFRDLNRAEQRQAKRAAKAFARGDRKNPKLPPTAKRTGRGGRPTRIDPALVLYCARILCEQSGKASFPLSRNGRKDEYGGPMWRALLEIFPAMQSYVAIRSDLDPIARDNIARHSEAIAGVLKIAKSPAFRDWCAKFGLGPTSADVANDADTFRYAFTVARKVKRSAHRTRIVTVRAQRSPGLSLLSRSLKPTRESGDEKCKN